MYKSKYNESDKLIYNTYRLCTNLNTKCKRTIKTDF